MKLNGKKILFIAPAFFGYEEKIAEKMIELGAAVDFFDERSIKSSFERALLKINPQIFHKKTMSYYNQIIDKISNVEYDFIFVIKCEMMPVEIISTSFPCLTRCAPSEKSPSISSHNGEKGPLSNQIQLGPCFSYAW